MDGKQNRRSKSRAILAIEGLGFIALLILAWFAEGVIVPHHQLPTWLVAADWHDAVLESLGIVAVGALVLASSARLIRRIEELEQLVRICAWCRRIHHEGRWMVMEQYFLASYNQRCTHGLCSDCAAKLTDDAVHLERETSSITSIYRSPRGLTNGLSVLQRESATNETYSTNTATITNKKVAP